MNKREDAKDSKTQEAASTKSSNQVTAAQAHARKEMKKIEDNWSADKLRNL